jgi:hypothetical protein
MLAPSREVLPNGVRRHPLYLGDFFHVVPLHVIIIAYERNKSSMVIDFCTTPLWMPGAMP